MKIIKIMNTLLTKKLCTPCANICKVFQFLWDIKSCILIKRISTLPNVFNSL